MKFFSDSLSFIDDEFSLDDLEIEAPCKDNQSMLTACSVTEVNKAALVTKRILDESQEVNKRTATYVKSIDPTKLKTVAKRLFN